MDKMTMTLVIRAIENDDDIRSLKAVCEYDVTNTLLKRSVIKNIEGYIAGKNKILNIKRDLLDNDILMTEIVKLININKENKTILFKS